MRLKTIVVEDEALSRLYLCNMLSRFNAELEVVASVATEDEAVTAIEAKRPDLVLLDIELQQGSGFEVLSRLGAPYPYVIFTTAFDDRVLNIIRFSGTDFLQKPIDMEALSLLVNKLVAPELLPDQPSLYYLRETLANNFQPQHMAVNTGEGTVYVRIADIIRIEAAGQALTRWILREAAPIAVLGNIGELATLMESLHFYRLHVAHLVNLALVVRTEPGSVTVINGDLIPVSPKKEERMKELLMMLSHG